MKTTEPKYHFVFDKSRGIPSEKEFNKLPFGRKIEFFKKIDEFKQNAKRGHIDQKRRTLTKGKKEFKDLYRPKEFFFVDDTKEGWKSDSLQVWYTPSKETL
jgi:hypothetical protein